MRCPCEEPIEVLEHPYQRLDQCGPAFRLCVDIRGHIGGIEGRLGSYAGGVSRRGRGIVLPKGYSHNRSSVVNIHPLAFFGLFNT